MIRFTPIEIGTGGLPRCRRCGGASMVRPRDFDPIAAEITEACTGWAEGPGPNIDLVGMDGFDHPRLPSIVHAARAAGAQRIKASSSGAGLLESGMAEGAVNAGLLHLELVLLAGDRAASDDISGISGSLAAVREGAGAWRAAAGALDVKTALTGRVPVCEHNVTHVPSAVAALSSAGAIAIELDVAPALASSASARVWLAAAVETGAVAGCWVWVRGAAGLVAALHERAPVVWTAGDAR